MIIRTIDYSKRGILVQGGSAGKEPVTFDLTVGEVYTEPGHPSAMPLEKTYELRPNKCVLVWTKESLSVPDGVFGQIFSRVSFSLQGLVVANTKVDPLFCGPLAIPVFNAGSKPIPIRKDDRFCSVVFQTLEAKTASQMSRRAPVPRLEKRSKVKEFWVLYGPQIIGALIIALIAGIGGGIISKFIGG